MEISLTELGRRLGISVAGAGYSVEKGEIAGLIAMMQQRNHIIKLFFMGFGIFMTLLLTACTASLTKGHVSGPKTYKIKMDQRFDGYRRSYLVHVPPGANPDKPLPLVVVIHGAFDTAKGMEKFSGFSALADREGFVALYPNGIGIMGFLQHWNAGHCCGKAAQDNWDDVGFVAAAIKDASTRIMIDPDRIYMVGFSNGGMLTYRFAAERGNLLAAAAPLAASIGGKPSQEAPEWHIPKPKAPISIIAFHGLSDDDVPVEGGISRYRKNTRSYWSVEKSIDFWVSDNACKTKKADTFLKNGYVQIKSWVDCRNGNEIVLYLLKDWGHVWPGRYFTTALEDTHPLKNFDAAEIIWDFFKRHRRIP